MPLSARISLARAMLAQAACNWIDGCGKVEIENMRYWREKLREFREEDLKAEFETDEGKAWLAEEAT